MKVKEQRFKNSPPTSKGGVKSRIPPCVGLEGLTILLPFTLLTLILTHPLIFNLTTTLPSDIGDPLLNTWILAWDIQALLNDPLNLFNANIFAPLPNTLAYSEHLISTAILILPLHLLWGEPVLTYNISLLLTFPLAGLGMYLLTLRWTGRRDAAFIGAFIFAFAPYRFAAIAHLQLLTFHWLPFALLFLDKILSNPQRPPQRLYIGLIIFTTLQFLASWYLAIYSALILAIFGLSLLIHHYKQQAWSTYRSLILSGLFIFLMTLPFVWPYIALLSELREARPLSLALSLAANPSDFLAATPFNTIFGPITEPFRTRAGFTEENVLFLGIIAPILALFALIPTRSPSRSLRGALGLILCLTLLLTFTLPYQTLATLLPPTTIIRVPPRWIIPSLFALSGLAAFGYNVLVRYLPRFRLLIPLVISLFLFVETLSIPLPLAPVENRTTLNPAYSWLGQQPADITVLELPMHSAPAPEFPEVKRLYASTQGWWQLINGYSGYTPPRQPQLAKQLANFPDEASLAALQNLAQASPHPFYLLVHPSEAPFDRSQWEDFDRWSVERQPSFLTIGEFEGDYLYYVQPTPLLSPETAPLATLGTVESIHLLDWKLNLQPDAPLPPHLILYWQTLVSQTNDFTVFIHLRASDGFVRAQADQPPVSNRYPTSQWQPNEVIQDIHFLPVDDYSQVDHLAIGLYNPATGKRLPIINDKGQQIPDDAFIILVEK